MRLSGGIRVYFMEGPAGPGCKPAGLNSRWNLGGDGTYILRNVILGNVGPLPAQETRTMTLRPEKLGLSSETYFLRIAGDDGAKTPRRTGVS